MKKAVATREVGQLTFIYIYILLLAEVNLHWHTREVPLLTHLVLKVATV